MNSAKFPRISEIHPAELAAFSRFLRGRTCPVIETDKGCEPGFYPWDYSHFRAGRICDALPETPPIFGNTGAKIAWLSDLHLTCESAFVDVATMVAKAEPDFVLLTGDLVECGLGRGITEFIGEIERTGAKAIFLLGNHDLYGWSFAKADEFRETYTGPGTLLDKAGPIHLGAGVYLAGNSGWGGGILQDNFGLLRDHVEILEYRKAQQSRYLEIAKDRADRLSAEFQLDALPADAQHLIFATHAPVIKKVSRYRDQPTDRLLQPHFVWPAMGKRLNLLRARRPLLGITVLSGHTHTRAFASQSGIHHVVAGAEYHEPRISAILHSDFFLGPERTRAANLRKEFKYRGCPAHPCLGKAAT